MERIEFEWDDEKVIRMISARKAEKLERDEYYGYY